MDNLRHNSLIDKLRMLISAEFGTTPEALHIKLEFTPILSKCGWQTMWQGSLTVKKGFIEEELIALHTSGNESFGSIEGILEYFVKEVTKKVAVNAGVELRGNERPQLVRRWG